MYKVLIVDDDFPVRMFLKGIIDWGINQCEIVGEAINGEEALEKIKDLNPDIVFLDINLPIFNGIEIMRRIKEMNYTGKVIILSLYDDFEYVKEALKLGALEYILKNLLTKESLIDVLNLAKEKLINEKIKDVEHKEMEELALKGLSAMKHQFILQLIQGELSDEKLVWQKIKELKLKINNFSNIVILIDIYEKAISYNYIDLCKEILNDFSSGEIEKITENRIMVIYDVSKCRSFAEMLKETYKVAERINTSINRYLNVKAAIGISDLVDKISNINKYYNQASTALELKFYNGNNKIFYYKDTVKFYNTPVKLSKEDEKDFIILIKNRKKAEAHKFTDTYFKQFKSKFYSPEVVYNFCMDIAFIINLLLKQYDLSVEDIYGAYRVSVEFFKKVETITEVQSIIDEIIDRILYYLNEDSTADTHNETIKEAVNYINCNYMKAITLNDVAGHIYMNPSYFSFLFKKATGKSYLEYLKYIRIKKAKELIETTDKKLNEISKIIGIPNEKTFSKLFKEEAGVRPNEYRRIKSGS